MWLICKVERTLKKKKINKYVLFKAVETFKTALLSLNDVSRYLTFVFLFS